MAAYGTPTTNTTILPLIGSGIPSRGDTYSTSKLINMYPIIADNDDTPKYTKALYPTPGTYLEDSKMVTPNGEIIRGVLQFNQDLYIVAGTYLYSLGSSLVWARLGTLVTASGRVKIIANALQIGIIDGIKGYTFTPSTSTFAQISDGDFPSNPEQWIFHKQRATVLTPNTGTFQVSDLIDFSAYNALNYATAESDPQGLVGIIEVQDDILLFGELNTEIWTATADNQFPYIPRPASVLPYGCIAPDSIVRINNSVIFLSKNKDGTGLLLAFEGDSQPRVMLDEHASFAFQQLTTLTDAVAESFEIDAHVFYRITFPTDNITFLFDVRTQQCIQWGSTLISGYDSNSLPQYSLGRHISDHIFTWNNKLYCTDYRAGRILRISSTTYTDYLCGADYSIYREVITPVISGMNERMQIVSVELDVEAGESTKYDTGTSTASDPVLTVAMSKDGGHTYSYSRQVSSGFIGAYKTKVRLLKWGEVRNCVLKITTNNPAFVGLYGLIMIIRRTVS